MSADVSRVRFDPLRDFAGVVLQQGRLLLDGDFNEYVALLDRRLRAETCDLTSFGPDSDEAGTAWVPRQTPDAFRVTAAGGALTIGRGRMYVDGLLAENHGRPPLAFDPLLSEQTGTADPAYDQQPYWPTPEKMAGQNALPSGGPHLAYLDVWQREVTHVEAPDLVEVAVGVDTTARVQTAWQVRLLQNTGNATCESADDEIPGWQDLIRPSDGRLTSGTVAADSDDDPCELPPTGGYRGLENQTYRVEVHAGGAPGTATFKWSRENASVAIPVVEKVSATVLRLASVGKDDVLRISTGDWVEILDDRYELGQKPGVMRKVTVDDAALTITFAPALPADLQPASSAEAAARHLRVRRWDQSGIVRDGTGTTVTDLDQPGATGLVTIPTAASKQIVLEHGIVVSFSLAAAGGRFRAGDHWIFTARTADTSVEVLTAEPPLGTHHHYARLGFVTFPDGETDCRRMWPPIATQGGCGDCTVCVTAESHSSGTLTLQEAIDQVREKGGTVCLGPGTFDVGDGVTIEDARSVRVRGQGPATLLVGKGNAVTVKASFWTTIENLAVLSGAAASGAIRLEAVSVARLQDLAVLSYGGEQTEGAALELSGTVLGLTARANVFVGRTGISSDNGDQEEEKAGLLAALLRLEGNVVAGERGIDLGALTAFLYSCRISDNDVLGNWGGISATGAVAPGGSLDVSGNRIGTNGPGIAVGPDALVDSNTVTGWGNARPRGMADVPPPPGILVTTGDFQAAPGHVRITGNRVHDRRGPGIVLRAPVTSFMVKQNVVTDATGGIEVEGRGGADHVSIENNVLLDLGRTEASDTSVLALTLSRVRSAAVAGNTIARVGLEQHQADTRVGILVTGCKDVRIVDNDLREIGPLDDFEGVSAGVLVIGPYRTLAIDRNSIRFGSEDEAPGSGRWHAVLVQTLQRDAVRIAPSKAAMSEGEDAFVITSNYAYAAPRAEENVTVAANTMTGGGDWATCLVHARGDAILDANQCTHEHREQFVGIEIAASSIIASSNRVRGVEAQIDLQTSEDRYAATGNITTGGTLLYGSSVPGPWSDLNPVVS
jgi:hypothetical protein